MPSAADTRPDLTTPDVISDSLRQMNKKTSRSPTRTSKPAGVTPNKFRRLALDFKGASESAHMDHPDFRVAGRIFATLGYPGDDWGMVRLPLTLQKAFVKKSPAAFTPCNGAWGRAGCTSVHLPVVREAILRSALNAAWRNAIAKVD